MAQWIAVLLSLIVVNSDRTDAQNDICNLSERTQSSLQLSTDGWITHTSCICHISRPITETDHGNGNETLEDALVTPSTSFQSSPPQSPLYLYTTYWFDVRDLPCDKGDDVCSQCPAHWDIRPSEAYTIHLCPTPTSTPSPSPSTQEPTGRMATFVLGDDGITVHLRNPRAQNLNLTMHLSGSGQAFRISCSQGNDSAPAVVDTCPCGDSSYWPFYTEDFSPSTRALVGVFSALALLLVFGGVAGFMYYRARKDKGGAYENEKKDLAASQNPAFEAGPDPMYAEIGTTTPTVPRGLDLNQLPFTPDPNLRLGLDARYSMDSGLYSEPGPGSGPGHGALEGPSIMRISQQSLSRISQGSTGNRSLNGSRNPVVMSPMTPDEIDALYAKPNKARYPTNKAPSLSPKICAEPMPPTPPPKADLTTSSNQSLPSFRDPNGSQQFIPPPLATGSRSNSHSNVYNNAPLGLSLQQQHRGGGGGGGDNSSHNLSSSMSIGVSMQETDV